VAVRTGRTLRLTITGLKLSVCPNLADLHGS